MKTQDTYFFFMKVERGNSGLYPKGKNNKEISFNDKLDHEEKYIKDKIYDLYTGYSTDEWYPHLEGQIFKRNIFDGNLTDSTFPLNGNKKWADDLFWLSFANSVEHYSKSKVLVFGKKYLFIFELVPGSWTKNNIQAKLIKKINRSTLPPSIDSLSVYQYLNQGTFRPLTSCGQGREDEFQNLNSIGRLKTYSIKFTKDKYELAQVGEEYGFANLVRKYIESMIEETSFLPQDKEQFLLLSPSQLEAAASYFAMDLGFLPDYYAAGSIAIYDVRGRRPKSEFHHNPKLKNLLACEIDVITNSEISKRDILQIQCKDYGAKSKTGSNSNIVSKDDLHFVPTGITNTNIISLETVLDKMKSIRIQEKMETPSYFLELWWQQQIDLFKIKF